jgi:hypothetical protein
LESTRPHAERTWNQSEAVGVASMTTKGPRTLKQYWNTNKLTTHQISLLLINSSHPVQLPLFSLYSRYHLTQQQPWHLKKNSKAGSATTRPPSKGTCNGANSSLRSGRKTTSTLKSLTAACAVAILTCSRLAGARLLTVSSPVNLSES